MSISIILIVPLESLIAHPETLYSLSLNHQNLT